MPPTRVRDLERERRPQCLASDELVAPGTAVNAEVALVHEPDDCPGTERDLHDCAPILVTEVLMNELHVGCPLFESAMCAGLGGTARGHHPTPPSLALDTSIRR